jgi:hypothetical protein
MIASRSARTPIAIQVALTLLPNADALANLLNARFFAGMRSEEKL